MYTRIRELREKAKISQEKMAVFLDINQTTYSRYETGKLDIPSQSLIKIATYYETSVDYLLDITNESTPYPRK
ncbi:MAG TPA: helix-turn-helix domain-containing protein [Candidatus Tetragenococcus pullicola]|nr:helix-turn-helix domain-containing protein [Candidatus Tetragenococcus pullicola]